MMVKALVLVSSGCNPVTGRPRRTPEDSRALELAMQARPDDLSALHAGDPADPALRQYLGMGLHCINVVAIAPGADPYPALLARIRSEGPDLVACGALASDRDGDGLLAYALAEDLGWPILPAARRLRLDGGCATIEQQSRGRVRLLRASLPAVVTADENAPPPRQVAFARALRGCVRVLDARPDLPSLAPAWAAVKRAAQSRPSMDSNMSATQRLDAILASSARQGGVVLDGGDPDVLAGQILDYLRNHELVRTQTEGT